MTTDLKSLHQSSKRGLTLEGNRARKPRKQKPLTPLGAIRAKCLECVGECTLAVEECTSVLCPIHEFRFGKNPNLPSRSEKQTAAARINLAKGRGRKND